MLNSILMLRWGYYMPWFLASRARTTNANIYGYSILVGIGITAYQAAYSVVPTKVLPDEVAEVIQLAMWRSRPAFSVR